MFELIDWSSPWGWVISGLLLWIGFMLHRIGMVLQHIAQTHTELHMDELLEIRRRDEGRD